MKMKKRLLGILLSLVLVLGLIPGMSLTAYAADYDSPYASLVNSTTKVQFNDYDWYIIADNSTSATEGTVTLFAADNRFGYSKFADTPNSWSNAYNGSLIQSTLDNRTSTGDFSCVTNAIAATDLSDVSVTGAKLYLLDTTTASTLPQYILSSNFTEASYGAWWLRSTGGNNTSAVVVNSSNAILDAGATVSNSFGVRPALQLDLSKVSFSSVNLSGGANATVSGGSTVQNYFDYDSTPSAMADVTYTVTGDYKFPTESDLYTTTNGITVTRTSDKVVTVSGTPDGVANITIPDAEPILAAWEGSGTETDPYLISTEDNLVRLATMVNSGHPYTNTYFQLDDDITLTDCWTPIGYSKRANYAAEAQAPYFAGTFDGNGKTISGLSNKVGDNTYTPGADSLKGDEYVYGLFGVVGNGAVIQNLTLSGVDIDTSITAGLNGDSVGAAVGYAFGTATVSGVTVSGSVTAVDAVGGIVGRCYQVDSNAQRTITITDCCADEMTVTATGAKAGGIAGFIGDSNKGHYTIIVTGNSFDGTVSSTTYNSPIAVFGAFMFTDNQGVATPNTSGNQTGNIYNIDENTTNTGKTKLKVASDGTVSMLNPHVHDLTYAAGEGSTANTITAICSVDDCGLTDNKVTLTISAPTLTVYGQTGEGISEVATLTGLTEFNTASGKTIAVTDIKYYKATKSGSDYIKGDALDAAPTDAGNYIAEITVSGVKTGAETTGDVTASVGYTISKANPEAAAVTANNRTYDGTTQPLVTVTGEATGGEMQYALGTETEATEQYTTSIRTATNAGTYYVWYKVVDASGRTVVEAKCIMVTITGRSSGGGGSSSGSSSGSSGSSTYTPSTPVTPTTPTYTVPVSSDSENSVNISATIADNTARVSDISQSDLAKITDSDNTSGEASDSIIIDVSKAPTEVTSVELTSTSVESLKNAVDGNDGINSVEIKMTNVTVSVDAKTLTAISEQAGGKSIRLVVEEAKSSGLNEKQQSALGKYKSAQTFTAYFESDGVEIHDFNGGKASVSISFTPEQGKKAKYYHIFYITPAGKMERYTTWYANGVLSFETTHFSDYAIVYDTSMANGTGAALLSDNESELELNAGLKVSQTGTGLTVEWNKVKKAKRYEVYVAYADGMFADKPTRVVTSKTRVNVKSIGGKPINTNREFMVYIIAGKNKKTDSDMLCVSYTAYAAGRNNKVYTDQKEIKLAKTKKILKTGKKFTIKASSVLINRKRKLHEIESEFRYASSDRNIATVNSKGKVTAKKPGTCYIYVYGLNGNAKKIKLTVK